MFSGIVEEIGHIAEKTPFTEGLHFYVHGKTVLVDTKIGDSIAVNGVCLTVTSIDTQGFTCQAVPETLSKTNLGLLEKGQAVNLERAMTLSTRIGGHFVQGHIDTTTQILDLTENEKGLIATFYLPPILCPYIVEKGYITIDGMSLTVVNCQPDAFSIAFIPHTRSNTIVQSYQITHTVNIEVDVLAKYVYQQQHRINLEKEPLTCHTPK